MEDHKGFSGYLITYFVAFTGGETFT